MSQVTRRAFMAASAATLTLPASLAEPARERSSPAAGAAANGPRPWYETMRRCGQLNLNEIDPRTIRIAAWMDYWARLKMDAVLINGGGILAFYPTQVPYQRQCPYLDGRDIFGEMSAAARARGLRVVSRMDCNFAYQEALDAHPEWFARNRDGSVRRNADSPWLFQTCMFSRYFTEQMPAIYREINRRYSPDGFFTNGWPSTGPLTVCYCDNCRKIYHAIGGAPPEFTDAASPVYRKFYAASMERIAHIWQLWSGVVREGHPDSVYVGNLGGGLRTVKDLKTLGETAAWFNADNQGRWNPDSPLWECAQQGRVARSVMGGKTVTNVTGAYCTGYPDWRHSSKPAAEMQLWLAQTAASGMVPWLHWLGASPRDIRWQAPARRFYDWLAEQQRYFVNRRSLARIAVLYPQSTIAFYRARGERERKLQGLAIDPVDYLQGLYYALLEGRFAFDFIHQENLTPEVLRPYTTLLAPNAAYLRDGECAALKNFVRAGGSLLATFETSRYNEWGEAREDFGLRELWRVSALGDAIGPKDNSYMRMNLPHPALAGFRGTRMLPGPQFRVPVSHLPAGELYMSVIPAYPAFPPEMVWPRVRHTLEPAAVLRQQGRARIAYFPGDIDRTAWISGNPDLNRLLAQTVAWLAEGTPAPARVRGAGIFELFAWETEAGPALHIVNYTNPNMTKAYARRLYPIGPLRVTFRLPDPTLKPRRVRALRAKAILPFTLRGGAVHCTVPRVEDYEVIAIE